MVLVPIVGSSRIRAYGWEEARRDPVDVSGRAPAIQRRERAGLLQLEFMDGARWYYFNVPVMLFEAWMMSRSKGSFFHNYIRGRFNERPAAEVERVQTSA